MLVVDKIMKDAQNVLIKNMNVPGSVIVKSKNGNETDYHFSFSPDSTISLSCTDKCYIARTSFRGKARKGQSKESMPNAVFNLYIECLKID